MKIFINSLNRAEIISTHLLLDADNIPYTIILHDEEQKAEYLKNPTIREETILVANRPVGMTAIRAWMNEELVETGEWYLILDDNITEFTAVPEPYYDWAEIPVKEKPKLYRDLFETGVSAARFMEICAEGIAKAEKTGVHLIGFASNVNFFFRQKKWRDVGYVIGKTQLIQKTDLRYDLNVFATDDYLWTAQNLERFGAVLVNNFCVAIKKHYAKGGIGQYDKRLAWKLKDVEYLMERFPGLFRFKEKAGKHPKSEIQTAFISRTQVERWRFLMRQKAP